MSYELSFAPEFFTGEELYPAPTDEPRSLLEAIVSLPDETFREVCLATGLTTPELADFYVQSEMAPFELLEHARRVDSCSNLSVPVEVWLDEGGFYTVEVY